MSYSSASRSTFTGGGQKNANDELDEYGGKKSGASRLKNSSGTKKDADVDEEYPKYANVTKDDADRNRYNSSNSGGSDGYNSGGIVVRGAGGGAGGYGNSGGSSTAYSSGSGGYGNSVLPYGNIVIHTNEVHLHHHRAAPGYGYDGDNRNDDQRRRGGGGGGSGFIDRN